MTPAISVILPAYNATATIAAAVDSVLRQSEKNFELIAVDDGSTDATLQVLSRYRDERLNILSTGHAGIVHALSTGIQAARAELIARMDADDVCRPLRLELQREFLDRRPEIGLVACAVEFGGDPVQNAGYAAYVDWTNGLLEHERIATHRFVESPLIHPSVMFRTSLIQNFGGYRAGPFPEDYELWLRWLDAGVRMEKIERPLLIFNDSPTRLSRTDARYSLHAFYACKAHYLACWLKRHNPYHPHIVLWGAGRQTRKRANLLSGYGVVIDSYIDIDPKKVGNQVQNRPVRHATDLCPKKDCFVVSYVANRGARDDIRSRLESWGYRIGLDFILAA